MSTAGKTVGFGMNNFWELTWAWVPRSVQEGRPHENMSWAWSISLKNLVRSDDLHQKLGKFHQLFITGKRTVLKVCCQMGRHSPKGTCVLGNAKCWCLPYSSVSQKSLLSVYGPAAQPGLQVWDSQEVPIPLKGSGLTPFSLCLPVFSQQWGLLSLTGVVPCQFERLFVSFEVVRFSNFVFSDYSLPFFAWCCFTC